MPEVSGRVGNLPNPADAYGSTATGARDYIGGLFNSAQNGSGGVPGSKYLSDFRDTAGNLINQSPGQQPVSDRPDFYTPQTYARPGDPNFSYDNRNAGGFDPNAVAGPNVSPIEGSGLSLSGNAGTPGWNEALNAAREFGGGGGVNVPREQIGGSGFQKNPMVTQPGGVSNAGFGASLEANRALSNSSVDADTAALEASMNEADQATFKRAAQLGREAAAGRGSYSPEGDIAGGEMGSRLSDAALQSTAARRAALVNARLQALGIQSNQRIAGAGNLTSLGSAAGEAAGRNAGILQNESQYLGNSALQQRGQDIEMAKTNATLGGQSLSGVADVIRATGGESTDYERMRNERARLGLDTQTAQTGNELGGYKAQTERIGTEGNIAGQSDAARTAQYQAETARTGMESQARQAANDLGFNYDEMDANQWAKVNDQMNTRYGVDVTGETARNQTASENYKAQLNTAAQMYGADVGRQGNDIERQRDKEQFQTRTGELAQGILNGQVTAQQAANELAAKYFNNDADRAMQFVTEMTRQEQNRWTTNQTNRANLAGSLGGGYISAGGQVGAAAAGGA